MAIKHGFRLGLSILRHFESPPGALNASAWDNELSEEETDQLACLFLPMSPLIDQPLTTAGRFIHHKSMTRSYKWRQKERMPTTRKAITFSMPPEMAEQVQQVLREEGRNMSEFLREAIRLYMEEREWLRQGRRQRAEARRDEGE